jgi:hypothetical protein
MDAHDQSQVHAIPIIQGTATVSSAARGWLADHVVIILEGEDVLGEDQHVGYRDGDPANWLCDDQPFRAVWWHDPPHYPLRWAGAAPPEQGQQVHRRKGNSARNRHLATAYKANPCLDFQFADVGPSCDVGCGTVPADRGFIEREKHARRQSHVESFLNETRGRNVPVPPSGRVFMCKTENLGTKGQDAKAPSATW